MGFAENRARTIFFKPLGANLVVGVMVCDERPERIGVVWVVVSDGRCAALSGSLSGVSFLLCIIAYPLITPKNYSATERTNQ